MSWENQFDVRIHRDPLDGRGRIRVVLWETLRDFHARWGHQGPAPALRLVSGFEEEDRVDGEPVEPSFTMSDEAAQKLMDQLFEAGFRPSGAAGTAGQLSAVEGHLKDMRVLVGKAFGVSLP